MNSDGEYRLAFESYAYSRFSVGGAWCCMFDTFDLSFHDPPPFSLSRGNPIMNEYRKARVVTV